MRKYRWVGGALLEFVIVLGVSALPMLGGIAGMWMFSGPDFELGKAVLNITANGELIVYSATLMAPIIYAVLKDPPVSFRAVFAIFGAVPVFFGTLAYAVSMHAEYSDRVISITGYILAWSIVVYFALVMFLHEFEARKSAPQIQDDQRRNSLDGYKEHRGVRS